MVEQSNPPDRDDAITERAVSMDSRPLEAGAGAGRAINAAFSRNRTSAAAVGGGAGGSARDDDQQEDFQGAGYPTEDMDDVDPKRSSRDESDRSHEEGLETGDGMLEELMTPPGEVGGNPDPKRSADDRARDSEVGEGEEDDDGYRVHEEGLETGDGMLEDLMTPPGGDALGGDRDTDPNLNGGHGIKMQAPEEGPIPIEDEPTDLSVIGHGHEDKAAWNRERIAMLQGMENDERDLRGGTSEDVGLGGAALSGALEGWEGGNASPTIDQGDTEFDAELSEEEEVLGDVAIEDMADDVLGDASINDPNNMPFLPEHRDLPDDNMSLEERLVATPGEDILSSGAELGVVEELEAEDLNQTDSITRRYEDDREFLDDAMDGNERRDGAEVDRTD